MEDMVKKLQTNYKYFLMISLVFGVMFTATFYRSDIGIMYTIFVIIVIGLCVAILRKLEQPIKKSSYYYFVGIMLLGIATFITSSSFLHFFNTVGILLLLDVCLLQQFHDDSDWTITKYLKNLFKLAINVIASIDLPFRNTFQWIFSNTKLSQNKKARSISIGLCLAIPFLIIIIFLLSGADMIFGALTLNLFSKFISPDILGIKFMFILGFVICYCVICGTCRFDAGNTTTVDKDQNKKDPMIAITFMGCITVIYILFCVIQFVFLFSGGKLGLPNGVTYSMYAREGFFQLLFVTMLNFSMVIMCLTIFKQHKILKFILLIMSACTYIMIASAIFRMILYVGSYNLSFLRVLVLWFLVLNVFFISGSVVFIIKSRFNLFKYCVVVLSVGYIILAFARPDSIVAAYNVENTDQFTKTEIDYLLGELSYDAAPYIMKLEENTEKFIDKEEISSALIQYNKEAKETQRDRTWREFNLSYYLAGNQIKINY